MALGCRVAVGGVCAALRVLQLRSAHEVRVFVVWSGVCNWSRVRFRHMAVLFWLGQYVRDHLDHPFRACVHRDVAGGSLVRKTSVDCRIFARRRKNYRKKSNRHYATPSFLLLLLLLFSLYILLLLPPLTLSSTFAYRKDHKDPKKKRNETETTWRK